MQVNIFIKPCHSNILGNSYRHFIFPVKSKTLHSNRVHATLQSWRALRLTAVVRSVDVPSSTTWVRNIAQIHVQYIAN